LPVDCQFWIRTGLEHGLIFQNWNQDLFFSRSELGTRVFLIYFLEQALEVLDKSKESPNIVYTPMWGQSQNNLHINCKDLVQI
jgi:hypothetical protein